MNASIHKNPMALALCLWSTSMTGGEGFYKTISEAFYETL